MVGNTVVDALLYTRDRVASGYRLIEPALAALPTDKKLVLATTHRHENIGDPIRYVLRALRTLGEDGDKLVGLPVDLHPDVRKRPARRLSRLCTQRSSACEAPLRSSTCSRARSNLLIGAREGAPLAVGYGEGEMYLGSDALALAPFTDRVAHLKDGDWVVVTREGADIRDALGRPVKRLREARFAVAKDIKERDLFLASQGISGMSDDDLMYAGDRPLDLEHGLLSCTWPDAGRQDCPFPDLWGHLG